MKISRAEVDAISAGVRSALSLHVDCLADARPVLARPLTGDEVDAIRAIDQAACVAYDVIADAIYCADDPARFTYKLQGLNTLARGVQLIRAEVELILQASDLALHRTTQVLRK